MIRWFKIEVLDNEGNWRTGIFSDDWRRYQTEKSAQKDLEYAKAHYTDARLVEDLHPDYKIGDLVEVHSFGHWYIGQVEKVSRVKIHVRYTTGTGVTRVKACYPSKLKLETR